MIGDGTGYTAHWRLFRVDRDTWADSSEFEGLESAHIVSSNSDLMQTGEFTVTTPVGVGFENGYYRLSMAADGQRVDVATLLCYSDDGNNNRGRVTRNVTGKSVLEPANTKKLYSGEFAPSGCDGAEFAAEMLRDCIAAPVEVDGSFTVESHVVFDNGSTVLQAVLMVLDAGNFVMQITGGGVVHIKPKPTTPALVLDRDSMRLLSPETGYRNETDVKNRYIAIEGASVAVAQNNDPLSVTSLASTGYLRDEYDQSPVRVNGETLQKYAERKLAELSVIKTQYTYTRDYYPDVYPNDIVRCSLPLHGLDGDMRITSCDIQCGAGIRINETAETEVATWKP